MKRNASAKCEWNTSRQSQMCEQTLGAGHLLALSDIWNCAVHDCALLCASRRRPAGVQSVDTAPPPAEPCLGFLSLPDHSCTHKTWANTHTHTHYVREGKKITLMTKMRPEALEDKTIFVQQMQFVRAQTQTCMFVRPITDTLHVPKPLMPSSTLKYHKTKSMEVEN